MAGPILIFFARVFIPLLILRFPLLGGLLAITIDYFDLNLVTILNAGNFINYQLVDKTLDFYYLTLEVIVASKWENRLVKNIALGLFWFRVLGIVLFEITQLRVLLVIFPNLFENFFIVYLIFQKIGGKNFLNFSLQRSSFKLAIFLVFSYKIYQELSLHLWHYTPWLGSTLLGLSK